MRWQLVLSKVKQAPASVVRQVQLRQKERAYQHKSFTNSKWGQVAFPTNIQKCSQKHEITLFYNLNITYNAVRPFLILAFQANLAPLQQPKRKRNFWWHNRKRTKWWVFRPGKSSGQNTKWQTPTKNTFDTLHQISIKIYHMLYFNVLNNRVKSHLHESRKWER